MNTYLIISKNIHREKAQTKIEAMNPLVAWLDFIVMFPDEKVLAIRKI